MISSIDLKKIAGEENVLENEPLATYTTFGTGGPADFLVTPENISVLCALLDALKKSGTPYFLIGRGSNLLVGDRGFRGVVILLRKHFHHVTVSGNEITAESGVMMPEVASVALKNELSGFEFASGIPGTLGGGLVMNAGAYGSELRDVVKSAQVLTADGEICERNVHELALSYRHSALMENGDTVLSVTLSLTKGCASEIKARMDELNQKRRSKQPLEFGSAGSTFKRPEGYFAGALIEEAGLKGYHVGNAYVSEKHAGFVVNKGNASAKDVMDVIRHVQSTVKEKYGVALEMEVRLLGEF